MQGVLHGVVYMGHDDYGPDVTRKDGSRVGYVACYDTDSKEIVKFTIAPGFDGELPEELTPVEVTFQGNVRAEASITSEGRAFARGTGVKLQALSLRAV